MENLLDVPVFKRVAVGAVVRRRGEMHPGAPISRSSNRGTGGSEGRAPSAGDDKHSFAEWSKYFW